MIHENIPFSNMVISSINNKSARLSESLDKTNNTELKECFIDIQVL